MNPKPFSKYQNLDSSLLNFIYTDLVTKYNDTKLLEQKFRALVHQIWGSYYTSKPNFKKLMKKIKESDNPKEYIFTLLQIHSSTKERGLFYPDFYTEIFDIVGQPKSILDIGCGFNPLYFVLDERFKFMNVECVDIDKDEIAFLNEVFGFFNLNSFEAKLNNVFDFDYSKSYDLVLLLKLLPVIEQQKRGDVIKVLKKIKAKCLVISFPTKSIGGKLKGMENNYREYFLDIAKILNYNVQEILFENELVFICSHS